MYRVVTNIEGVLKEVENEKCCISFNENDLYFTIPTSMQNMKKCIGKKISAFVEMEKDDKNIKGIEVLQFEVIEELDKEKVEKDFKKLMSKLNIKDLTQTIINMRHGD